MEAFICIRNFHDLSTSNNIEMSSPNLRACRTVPDRLRRALSRGMLEDFWALVKAGADIDTRDRLNRTPLHLVIYWKKDLNLVKAVLSAGADPNAIDHHGFTPLHAAIHSLSSPAIIKALLSAGADIDAPDKEGSTVLMKCLLKKENVPVIRALLSGGANVNAPNLLSLAVKAKTDNEILRLLLMAGASVNEASDGYPPIFYAVLNGDPITVKMLLVAGARVDFQHPERRSTLLHQAAVAEIAKELIKHGVNVNAVDNQGETPLHRAIMGDHQDVVMTLIKAGADVHTLVLGKYNNCLHLARSAPVIRTLISHGVNINARNRRGQSPLHKLILSSCLLSSPLMRIRGIYVRYYKDSCCPEMRQDILAVKEMIKHGANVNASDYNNKTVLELVISHGHSKMVQYMIKHGLEVCWEKLLRLTVINQSAIQLLIRESLIGNVMVKGKQIFDFDPNEQPLLQSMKQTWEYMNQCIEEIELMKKKHVNCNYSIFHFAVEVAPKLKPLKLCSHHDVKDEEYSALFPIYRYQIATRFNQCYKRALLLDVLENTSIYTPNSQGNGIIDLIHDCKIAIAEFLNNNDLLNLLIAMGFDVIEDGHCPGLMDCAKQAQ